MSDTPPSSSTPEPKINREAFIIAVYAMTIGAGTVAAVFWRGDSQLITAISNLVIGYALGGATQYYFGSSHASKP